MLLLFGGNPFVRALSGIAGLALVGYGLGDHKRTLALLGAVMLVASVVGFATRRARGRQ
jgi:hypothetical protein